MSLVTKKPVFGVCDQVGLTPACSATKTSYRLAILDMETRGIILSKQRTIKVLIRLRRCVPLLFTYGINRFSDDVAQILMSSNYKQQIFFCDLVLRPFNIISFISSHFSYRLCGIKTGDPLDNRRSSDYPQAELGMPHVTQERLEHTEVRDWIIKKITLLNTPSQTYHD